MRTAVLFFLLFIFRFAIAGEFGDSVPSKSFVVGDLGGVEVKIPNHFAKLVEYELKPAAGKNSNSKSNGVINSFGFDVKYPEMIGTDDPVAYVDFKNRKVFTSRWIWVGVNSGSAYSGVGSISRLIKNSLNRMLDERSLPPNSYERLSRSEYGLQVYAPKGVDVKTSKPHREHKYAEDVFISNGDDGGLVAYIQCSNREILSAPCRHYFSLEPKMHAEVSVRYRRGLLSDWREIQLNVQKMIYEFEVNTKNHGN